MLIYLLVVLSVPLCAEAIFGGEDVTKAYEYPWMVWLDIKFKSGRSSCSGNIISKNKILTAAHCILNESEEFAESVNVISGHLNMCSNEAIIIPVGKILSHPEYDFRPFPNISNDLAILELTQNLSYSNTIKAINLPSQNYTDENLIKKQTKFSVVGWGRTENNTTGNLKKIEVLLQETEKCITDNENSFRRLPRYSSYTFGFTTIPSNKWVCASGFIPHEQGACFGDSGGPLMMKNTQNDNEYEIIGVLSFIESCESLEPDVYVRVSEYMPWIERNLENFVDPHVVLATFEDSRKPIKNN